MRDRLAQLLDRPGSVGAASALTLAIGLVFTFVRAPHPWGWQGIDQYHELARALARGEPFGTTDVPWGYAYYVAAWYAIFGEQTWLPVLGQVVLNAAVPFLLYALVRPAAGTRVAVLSAWLAAVLSFNTVYASTQASDAICTVLFLASLVALVRGHLLDSTAWFAVGGLLAGLVPQFRPNMILLPLGLAVLYALLPRPTRQGAWRATVCLALVALALTPWVVRNYRLTGEFLPTSTHGGVQLWYGSLQVGPYLESRAHNPRSVFEWPVFDYTSLHDRSILVAADMPPCAAWPSARVDLLYWTDREPVPKRLGPARMQGGTVHFELPGQPLRTTVYAVVESSRPQGHDEVRQGSGTHQPFVFFVDDDHLGDLDRHDDLLDTFDLVRLVRHLAWDDPLPRPDLLDLDADGTIDPADLDAAVALLLPQGIRPAERPLVIALDVTPDEATLRLSDGSALGVPRSFGGRVTDLGVRGALADALVTSHRPWAALDATARPVADPCRLAARVRFNEVFYRREVHQMRRYLALARDNISRDPAAFAAASAYRMVRLFIIRGTDDDQTTQQFAGSRLVYGAGLAISTAYLIGFLAGVLVAWRRRSMLLLALIPILYVPATISVVLTNMRYSITVQPLMFAFIALALVALLGLDDQDGSPRGRYRLHR